MYEDHVARLHARRIGILPIDVRRRQIIRGHKPDIEWTRFRSRPVRRINVVDVSAYRWHRFLSCMHGHRLLFVSGDTVRVGKHEAAFIVGVRLQVENTSRKHVRRNVRNREPRRIVWVGRSGRRAGLGLCAAARSHFLIQTQQRHRVMPLLLAFPAIGDFYLGVPVIIAGDSPLRP